MTTDTTLSTSLQNRLEDWFANHEAIAPSINYAVFDRNGSLFHHGVGEFNRDGRAPGLDTVYRICSMSKSFCVACVLALRDAGLLSLSDPVRRYVPEFPAYTEAGGAETPVTIEMLMNNSSGLPEDNAWADYHLSMSGDTLLATLTAGLNFSSPPGTEYQYSNIGFAVLGLVVEKVSGMEFSEFADLTLLQPLGLTRTRYDPSGYAGDGPDAVEIASGYQSFDEGATWFVRPFVGTGAFACAGALFSTLRDVARWSAWLSSAWDVDNHDDAILSRASRRSMQQMTMPINIVDRGDYPATGNLGYGYGLNLEEDVRFGTIAQHSGGLPGFSGNMRWHCSSGIGIAVFANTNGQRTWSWAAEMLREVLLEVSPPAKDIVLWRSTMEAAEAIDDVVSGHRTFEDVGHLISPNVFDDIPADLRIARLEEVVKLSGGFPDDRDIVPLEHRWEWSVSAAQLCWRIPAATGSIECRIEMTETEPSVVQRLDITRADEDPAPDVVTRFYRPRRPGETPLTQSPAR